MGRVSSKGILLIIGINDFHFLFLISLLDFLHSIAAGNVSIQNRIVPDFRSTLFLNRPSRYWSHPGQGILPDFLDKPEFLSHFHCNIDFICFVEIVVSSGKG